MPHATQPASPRASLLDRIASPADLRKLEASELPVLADELRGAIAAAHRAGLQIIGQQIEDPQAAAAMWMSGIDFIQGNVVQSVGSELDFDFQNTVL